MHLALFFTGRICAYDQSFVLNEDYLFNQITIWHFPDLYSGNIVLLIKNVRAIEILFAFLTDNAVTKCHA